MAIGQAGFQKPPASLFEAHADDPDTLWGLMATPPADSSDLLAAHFDDDPRTAAALMNGVGRSLTNVGAVVAAATQQMRGEV